jgi:hypothetical protein
MEWTRSDTLALAMHSCTQCRGAGLRFGKKGAIIPCNCVLRSIFRICFERFHRCVTQEKHLSHTGTEPHRGKARPTTWGRKDEEYIADFTLIARRTLEESEYRLFRYHFLLGADWKLCAGKLGLDRGNFFHALYRIEKKLGRVFRELQPYPLFPVDEYFHGTSKIQADVKPHDKTVAIKRLNEYESKPTHLRFPVPVGKAA